MSVEVATTGREPPAGWAERAADLGAAALDGLGVPDAELSIVLCDDAAIAALNRDWRGMEQPTDVLSFPLHTPARPGELPMSRPLLLGDVVVSHETAARQAAEVGHAALDELAVLLVHGICHLLGWDHGSPAEAHAMAEAEAALLARVSPAARGLVSRATDG